MSGDHVSELRQELLRHGLAGFIVPRADEHLGEYVPASAERLAWLTGFTGSAGLAVVLAERAAMFTDGRYILQARAQCDAATWELRHIIEEPPPAWLADAVPAGALVGYDPLLISEDGLRRFTEAGVTMIPLARNPIDAVWTDRPAPPMAPAVPHPLTFAGRSSAEKREEVAEALRKAKQDSAVLTDPASIAWLLNIRGDDVPFTPFALGFALQDADGNCDVFMDPRKIPEATRTWLGNGVAIHPAGFEATDPLPKTLGALRGKRVRVDAERSPAWFAQNLRAAGAEVVAGMDPCLLPKASKNATEQQGARDAHLRDAVAVCRFLEWLDGAAGHATELSAAARLLAFREELSGFRGESFPAISGAGEHGAIIHYRVTPESDRPIRVDELYLIDSGAQFAEGTTDVTRTIWTGPGAPPASMRDRFTRVLKGHIAIATAVFPAGVAGPHLDAFARQHLWQAGLDFDHGTGHGVGSFLSVHEGPVSLSRAAKPVPIAAGMILSDEPGFYAPGEYGIRLENLLMVQPAAFPASVKPFLRFETLTLAPFDRNCIATHLLTHAERAWIDAYHARVLAEVAPLLGAETRAWLASACAALAD
jgi:Xaa-Pro aminopeptidase